MGLWDSNPRFQKNCYLLVICCCYAVVAAAAAAVVADLIILVSENWELVEFSVFR